MGLASARRDQHLHGEEFRKDKVFARFPEQFPSFGEMDCANRFAAVAVLQVLGKQRLNRRGIKLLKKSVNNATEHSLRKALGSRIDRRDPAKMNRFFLVVIDHFEL